MVWDREAKGPALFNGHHAIGPTELEATEILQELNRIYRSTEP
jgi:hypothetical protein